MTPALTVTREEDLFEEVVEIVEGVGEGALGGIGEVVDDEKEEEGTFNSDVDEEVGFVVV